MPNPYQRKTAWAGADIQGTKPGRCKRCGSDVLLCLVATPPVSTLKWKNFAKDPVERNGLRVYLLHACPR